VAVLTLIGEAFAKPKPNPEIESNAETTAALIIFLALPKFTFVIHSPEINKKSTDTECTWIIYNEDVEN
jgi:hypothetical protein